MMQDIGEIIRKRRLELGMTQAELAKKVGYTSKVAVTMIENGNNSIPLSKVELFAEALQTTTRELLKFDDVPNLTDKQKLLVSLCFDISDKDIDVAIRVLTALKGEK